MEKIILLGGGSQYTGHEQVERIQEVLPQDLTTTTQTFELKPYSISQNTEFAKILNPKMPDDAAEIMASAYLRYFRIPRRMKLNLKSNRFLGSNDIFTSSLLKNNLSERFMTDECLKKILPIQIAILEKAREAIRQLS